MTKVTSKSLRADIGKLEIGRGQRYPSELKARITTWAKAEHGPRAGWQKLGAEIGVHAETLRSWCAEKSMRRVVVEGRASVLW